MPSLEKHDNANGYWRSLAELNDTAEFRRFLESEFPLEAEAGRITRRRWLQLMGASLALATAAGCRWEKAEILPFAKRPPERTPGQPQRFATAMDLAGSAIGLLVTCVDGRPIKIEGNPNHPASLGATDALAQAAILELYDPDRSRHVIEKTIDGETVRSWAEFTRFARAHFGELRKSGGEGFRVLSEASSSPTLASMRQRLLKEFPEAQWYEYEPISRDNERAGTQLTFGKPVRTHYHLEKAKVIVCLDADLLGAHPAAVQYARDFARGREVVEAEMNRLYVIESRLSITGAAADHRLPLACRQMALFLRTLKIALWTAAIAEGNHPGKALDVKRDESDLLPQPEGFVRAVAKDLAANRGASLVAVGRGHPPELFALVHGINARLDNLGKTVSYTADPEPDRPSYLQAIRRLVNDISAGKVQSLLILGGNPVYNAPADLQFTQAMEKVGTSVHLSLYRNETSRYCSWHLPQAHFLESWGDTRAYDGTYSVAQPLIEPLCSGKSSVELVAVMLDDQPMRAEAMIRMTHEAIARQQNGPEDLDRQWRQTMHDGLLAESAWDPISVPEPAEVELPAVATERPSGKGALEVVFSPATSVYDGRFANNGWLQEWPDPITRLTWGNAALISPLTARLLGTLKDQPVQDGTIVKLKYKGRELEIPACVMPGQADGSVAVSLGYGRTAAGHVGGLVEEGIEPVGANAYKLRTSDAMDFGTGLTVEPTGKRFPLAGVQDHFAIDTVGRKARDERAGTLIREATLEHYRGHPDFASRTVHHPPLKSLWKEHEYEGYQWGMTIDLSKCTGCGACVVACQAENNVPIVGKQRILEGREMHWIRVDRYFRGDPADPQVVVQPVACQHCELAPCEQVCPVAATVHDQQGLNVMVYNRCVGTRYCSNNCPYKVRRFNFFNYHKDLADPANEVSKMVYNPEVTVRSRGVMEKCTYCLQRIRSATIRAKNDRRRIEDGEVQTACQQVCPTRAIIFGDLSDPQSRVARLANDERSYAILAELNVKPRTTYLARIRNLHPELETLDRDAIRKGAPEEDAS